MFGDLILWLQCQIKRHIFCKHNYKWVNRKDYNGGSFKECKYCGKIKNY